MAYQIIQQGDYRIFRVDNRHHILALDDRFYSMVNDYFTVARGSQGELRTRVNGPDKNHKLLRHNSYRLIRFRDDPAFQDADYLFLREDDQFRRVFLPDGLPKTDSARPQYKFSDHNVSAEALDAHLRDEPEGTVKQSEAEMSQPPIDDYFRLTAGDLAQRIRQMKPAELQDLEEYERRHKNRTTVLNTIDSQKRK